MANGIVIIVQQNQIQSAAANLGASGTLLEGVLLYWVSFLMKDGYSTVSDFTTRCVGEETLAQS